MNINQNVLLSSTYMIIIMVVYFVSFQGVCVYCVHRLML